MTLKQTVKIADATYAYIDIGEGEPLVLLHGFTGSKEAWEKHMQTFAKRYRVIAIDLPGHGETRSNEPRTMALFAQDLHEILQRLELSPVHLLGYSLGGRAALSYAINFPGNIRSLILESASPGLMTEAERKARQKQDDQLARLLLDEGIEAFVHYWENIPLFETQKALPKNVQTSIRNGRLQQSEEGLACSLRYMGTGTQPSWWSKLHTCNFPVLLVAGALDKKFVKINQAMHDQLKHARLEIVADAGHAVHIEQDEKFDTIVMEFLANQL